MRTYIKLFAVIASSALFSCSSNQGNNNSTKISGNIPDLANENIYFKLDGKLDSIVLDNEGNFSKTFTVENKRIVNFYDSQDNGYKRIYLDNGFDLSLQFNPNAEGKTFLEKSELTGKGSEYSDYTSAKNKFDSKNNLYRTLMKLSPGEFVTKLDSFENLDYELLNSFKLKNLEFVENNKKQIKYRYLGLLNSYNSVHKRYIEEGVIEVIDEKSQAKIDQNIIDSDEMASDPIYFDFLQSALRSKHKINFDFESGENYSISFKNYFFDNIKSSKLKEQFLYNLLLENFKYFDIENQDKFLAEFKELSQDNEKINKVQEAYNSVLKYRKGQPPYKWTLKDADGNEHSYSDYKGKLLYIDVWATWCGPCRAETPYIVQLEKDYRGKDIAFVSISIDKDIEAWKTMVKEEKLVWDQVVTPNAGQHEFLNYYGISGIPNFLLFDKEGNIIDVDAPRPSSEQIRKLIEENL